MVGATCLDTAVELSLNHATSLESSSRHLALVPRIVMFHSAAVRWLANLYTVLLALFGVFCGAYTMLLAKFKLHVLKVRCDSSATLTSRRDTPVIIEAQQHSAI
jgi:hypothetical protein